MSGDENGEENGNDAEVDAGPEQEPAFVDGGGNLGENGTTDDDSTKEVGP